MGFVKCVLLASQKADIFLCTYSPQTNRSLCRLTVKSLSTLPLEQKRFFQLHCWHSMWRNNLHPCHFIGIPRRISPAWQHSGQAKNKIWLTVYKSINQNPLGACWYSLFLSRLWRFLSLSISLVKINFSSILEHVDWPDVEGTSWLGPTSNGGVFRPYQSIAFLEHLFPLQKYASCGKQNVLAFFYQVISLPWYVRFETNVRKREDKVKHFVDGWIVDLCFYLMHVIICCCGCSIKHSSTGDW